MTEHRLIERMVKLMESEFDRISKTGTVDVSFIEAAVDFMKTYADMCHHGKEEGILFRYLSKKSLSDGHRRVMYELIEEHIYARRTVGDLSKAKESHDAGSSGSLNLVLGKLKELNEFYPRHIEKEDKHFFLPSMEYFTLKERKAMLREFFDFDRNLIHEKYQRLIERIEHSGTRPSATNHR